MSKSAFIQRISWLTLSAFLRLPSRTTTSAWSVWQRRTEPFTERREALARIVSTAVVIVHPNVAAAETVGKDDNCNDASCLGVWDGILANCPPVSVGLNVVGAGCISSQDDTSRAVFSEP